MYWNKTDSNTISVHDSGLYNNYPHMTPTTSEGYNCDKLQSSSILFIGSCDLDGPINDTNQSWARLLHAHLGEGCPYIALGKMTAGFMSFPRRILTYCERFGPPKKIYAVVPRPVAIEIPLSNGEIASVSNIRTFPNWLLKHKKVTELEHELLLLTSSFCRGHLANKYYQLYKFQEISSFIKVLCKLYNIEFYWTVNLSVSAIVYYHKFLKLFLENSDFMNKTFLGVAEAKDFGFDSSMGNFSQHEVFKIFTKPDPNNFLITLEKNLLTSENYSRKI